jgi:ferredoxin-NADP reductase
VSSEAAQPASRWQETEIVDVVVQTPHIVSVFLRDSIGAYEAGQHVDVRLTAPDGYAAERSYSIASAPGAKTIELAIERLDDGEVSPFFFDVARAGDTIDIRGPIGGHFVWRTADGGPLLLIGGGSGVVPLMAIARHRAATALQTQALLVYSARTWEDLAFREELLAQQSRDDNFSMVIATTRGARHRVGDLERRLDRDSLRAIVAQWKFAPRHVFVCGSNRFVEAMTGGLVQDGMPAARIRAERYGGTDG